MSGRIIIDVSSLARWTGPAVGMLRVEHELAAHARASGGAIELAFYDPRVRTYRRLNADWAATILDWNGAIDTWNVDRHEDRTGWRRFTPSRHAIVSGLERRRLKARSRWQAKAISGAQMAVLALRRHNFPFRNGLGQRIALPSADVALGDAFDLGPDDVVLSPASDWTHKDLAALAALKERTGFRLSVICYDIIPLTQGRFFQPAVIHIFADFWRRMFAVADAVIVNSQAVKGDIVRYCSKSEIAAPHLLVEPLGYRKPKPTNHAPLPPGLDAQRFILFVSTIEPRKNHAVLIAAWRRLLAQGSPQRHGFKLVFVGRGGWMVDDVMTAISQEPWQGSLLHLQNIDDSTLEALYAHAAFCVYPSRYEGFGLPVIEAFAHGKPVIASDGGALAEVAGPLGVIVDPDDEDGWTAALARWIDDPKALDAASKTVRERFSHPDWTEVAGALIAAAASAPRRDERQSQIQASAAE